MCCDWVCVRGVWFHSINNIDVDVGVVYIDECGCWWFSIEGGVEGMAVLAAAEIERV